MLLNNLALNQPIFLRIIKLYLIESEMNDLKIFWSESFKQTWKIFRVFESCLYVLHVILLQRSFPWIMGDIEWILHAKPINVFIWLRF